MPEARTSDISKFYVAGINYKKTDAEIRGLFAVGIEQYKQILTKAPSCGVNEIFVLSTCNRTEIYGFAEDISILIRLLCSFTSGNESTFVALSYTKQGVDAVEHLYHVAAGLDSQILGDYEIVGQIKVAVNLANQYQMIGTHLNRLVNSVLQSSKTIKNRTFLSSGTVSVSFAAVQYIKQQLADFSSKKILLLGVGKIGRSTCKNLVDYLGTRNITLINRSPQKAACLAAELGLSSASQEDMELHLQSADIIIVATNNPEPVILKSHLNNTARKLIIDLSIPYNVDQGVKDMQNISLINVDELSGFKDETLKKREAEVPKAKAIISIHMEEFMQWCEKRKHVMILKAVKTKLEQIIFPSIPVPVAHHFVKVVPEPHEKIQKVINQMAVKMQSQHPRRGCQYIEALNEFMVMVAN